jgi:hypothetical protein
MKQPTNYLRHEHPRDLLDEFLVGNLPGEKRGPIRASSRWGHPLRLEGADSIVLSGGYEDDEDHGDEIVYTGHGGKDQKTGKQVRDQKLTIGNLALARSHSRCRARFRLCSSRWISIRRSLVG